MRFFLDPRGNQPQRTQRYAEENLSQKYEVVSYYVVLTWFEQPSSSR